MASRGGGGESNPHVFDDLDDDLDVCEHGVKKFNAPSALTFKKKRYHGCLICISGVVSERYTDPSRKLPRSSTDFLAFVKFRSNVERDFLANLLMLMKVLEENGLLGSDGRQRAMLELMRIFGMKDIKAGSTLVRPLDTAAGVDRVALARVALELATALPVTYWWVDGGGCCRGAAAAAATSAAGSSSYRLPTLPLLLISC